MISTLALASCITSSTLSGKMANSPSTLLAEAFAACALGSKMFNDDSGFGFKPGMSVLGAYLDPGESVKFQSTLSPSQLYIFTAGGADPNGDIDIAILDEDERVLCVDQDESQSAGVSLDVGPNGATVLYRLTNAGPRPTFACMAALVNQNGWNIHMANLNNVIGKVGLMEDYFTSNNFAFFDSPNQWCLYGGVIQENTGIQAKQITFPRGSHIAMGFGDNQASNLDLFANNQDGDWLAKDEEADPSPTIALPDGFSGVADLTLKNTTGGDAFCLLTVYEKATDETKRRK